MPCSTVSKISHPTGPVHGTPKTTNMKSSVMPAWPQITKKWVMRWERITSLARTPFTQHLKDDTNIKFPKTNLVR